MFYFLFLSFFIIFFAIYRFANRFFATKISKIYNSHYFAFYISLVAFFLGISTFIMFFSLSDRFLTSKLEHTMGNTSFVKQKLYKDDVGKILSAIKKGEDPSTIKIYDAEKLPKMITHIHEFYFMHKLFIFMGYFLSLFLMTVSVWVLLKKASINTFYQYKIENLFKSFFLIFSCVAFVVTVSIFFTLLIEAVKFFKHVPIFDFLFGIVWSPESYIVDPKHSFGIIPLILGTILISLIAILLAIIIGILSAIYMSAYLTGGLRIYVKGLLEILAGIPSIIYGLFGIVFVAPFIVSTLKTIFDISVSQENALVAGIVIGIMILPLISSITDDVLKALPKDLKDGAIALGSMNHEVVLFILLPAAIPGIMSGIILALSRAVGETMVVVMIASLAANLTINPLEPVTTITSQIVMLLQGDQEFNNPKTLSAFALGFVLLVLTMILNALALNIVNRYRKFGV